MFRNRYNASCVVPVFVLKAANALPIRHKANAGRHGVRAHVLHNQK